MTPAEHRAVARQVDALRRLLLRHGYAEGPDGLYPDGDVSGLAAEVNQIRMALALATPVRPRTPPRSAATFGAGLTALREAAGLSVAQLASAAGLHRQSVHQYENGERRPTWDAVQKLAAALHVPTDTFRDPVK